MYSKIRKIIPFLCFFSIGVCFGNEGSFDQERWYSIMSDVRSRAMAKHISEETINATLSSPVFIPAIVKSDKNQAEFKWTLDSYLERVVNSNKVSKGKRAKSKYSTMLAHVDKDYGVPPHIILAFWGLESNYGEIKAKYKLVDAFFTLMYDGRREKFFGEQLLALMKTADDNKLDINKIRGSWAGAMGHFQFIPTTLAMYGVDGNNDGKIDIIDNVNDAMSSAGNYLNKLGWDKTQRIARRVMVPGNFDKSLMDGKTKKSLDKWAAMGVLNSDGGPLPKGDMVAGLVVDVAGIEPVSADEENPDSDVAPQPVIYGYLTYPNFYRIKRWNNSNWYAIAIAELADKLH